MIDPKVLELMNLAIDGVATPSERAKLDEHLAADPGTRSYYEALTHVVRQMNADPMPEPPGELEPRILDAVHNTPAFAPGRNQDPSTSWLKTFFAPRLRPWSTFGLGLAAGVFLLVAVQYGRPGFWDAARDINPSHVSGSMVSDRVALGSIPVDTPEGQVSGGASIYTHGDEIVVEVQLQSTVTVDWTLDFDDSWTLRRVDRRGSAIAAFAANRGVVKGLHTGEGGLTLTFAGSPDAAPAVVLKVSQGGQPVFEGKASTRN